MAKKSTKKKEAAPTKPQEATMPPLTVNAQYIKDLSFEHPNPVKTLQPSESQPDININIDVTAQNIQETTFEVVLTIKADAKRDKEVLFISEIQYAGLFTLGADLPKEAVHPILMIECPRMLFPFARSMIANVTREGGFPPLSLNPIDFAALYHQQMEQAADKKKA